MTNPILVKPPLSLEIQAERTNSGLPKTFLGGYVFVFAAYLYNCSPEIKTKNFKIYILILAIASNRNWLDASPP